MNQNPFSFPLDLSNPPKRYRPMVRWWWPGLDVEETELLRELDELNAFGVGGVEIQPLLFGVSDQIRQEREKYLHRYLTDFHFDILSKVLDKASRLDMFVDYTICSSWPPGGSHIDHEKNMQILIMGTDLINIKDKNTDSESAIKLPEMNLPPYYSKPKLVSGMVGFSESEFRFDLFKPVACNVTFEKGWETELYSSQSPSSGL